MTDFDALRRMLLERRTALEEIAESARESARPVELDQTRTGRVSRMDALQGQAMAIASEGRQRVERRRIEAALARLEAGEYGECLVCGEPIPEARLRADPTTTRCVACASRGNRA